MNIFLKDIFLKKCKKQVAFLITILMVVSTLGFYNIESRAADVNLLSSPVSGNGTAVANAYNPGSGMYEVDLTQYFASYNTTTNLGGATSAKVVLSVSSYTPSGTAGVLGYYMGTDNNWTEAAGWTAVSANQDITLTLSFPSGWGSTGVLSKIGVQFSNLTTGTSISYTIKSITLLNAGSGNGGGGNGGSQSGNIDPTKEYNFAKLLQYSLYFYDANMCGDLPSSNLVSWRGDCHTGDTFKYNGVDYPAYGGYHDAGDHVKFGLPMAYSMSVLGLGYYEYSDVYQELGQAGHLKNITDYGMDYFKRCTVLDGNGKVQAFCYQIGDGNADHDDWSKPEGQASRSYCLVADSNNPATDIISETVAALAINYINFGNADDYKYAKALFEFAKNNSKQVGTYQASFYPSDTWKDDYCFAAAMMEMAYQKAKTNGVDNSTQDYKGEYNTYISSDYSVGCYDGLHWGNVGAVASLYGPAGTTSRMDTVTSHLASKANSVSSYYVQSAWGSARYNVGLQFVACVYDKKMNTNTYKNWVAYQMSTILGNNTLGKSLVIGYGTNYPQNPHHRAASNGQQSDNASGEHVLLGALVGGPTSSDFATYNDTISDYTANEVACDYNAALPGVAAALYKQYKTSTEPGFSVQTVDNNYYKDNGSSGGNSGGNSGGDNPPQPVAVTSVSLNKTSANITLATTNSDTLTATVNPSNATDKTVTWTSSNNNIATVDSTGKVTFKTVGQVTITATSSNGKKATCTYTIKTPFATPNAPTVDSTTTTSVTLTPVSGCVYSKDGNNWQSSNVFTGLTPNTSYTFYVKKSAKDYYTESAKSAGTTQKTDAQSQNPNPDPVPVTKVTMSTTNENVDFANTTSKQLSVTVLPSNATTPGLTWTSSNNNIATVDNTGKVTFKAVGEVTITATSNNGKSASCIITIKKAYDAPTAPTVSSKTTNSVTLTAISGCEYSKDGTNWQSSNVFTGLTPNTSYTFYARKKASGYYNASAKSAGTSVKTDAESKPDEGNKPQPDPDNKPQPTPEPQPKVETKAMYRLYNPNSGEHFYTASASEKNNLVKVGWNYEGIAWYAPTTGDPVYRLYNANAGDHHYTLSAKERDTLVKSGWKFEGIAWYSGGDSVMYRTYNPNALAGSHHYTMSKKETDKLVSVGWKYEGTSWYGYSSPQ